MPATASAGRLSAACPNCGHIAPSGFPPTSRGGARAAVQVLEGNLRRVIGSQAPGSQLRALSKEAMRSYGRYWLEAFRLPVMPTGRLVAGMRDTGHSRAALEYLAAGRGVVFAVPHMGNYDLAAAWIIAKGASSITTVAERLQPESVYGRFVAFRESLGVEVLPASGGTGSSFAVLVQRLRASLSPWSVTAMSPAPASRWSSSARRPA
jgi:phosphatidylinositol dimannoside acyltransferase